MGSRVTDTAISAVFTPVGRRGLSLHVYRDVSCLYFISVTVPFFSFHHLEGRCLLVYIYFKCPAVSSM